MPGALPAAAVPIALPPHALDPMRWKSTTVFGQSLDDGRAFLLEQGAILSPNQFLVDNDAYNYMSVGSFQGTNFILTFEMLEAPLRHNTLRPWLLVLPFLLHMTLVHCPCNSQPPTQ